MQSIAEINRQKRQIWHTSRKDDDLLFSTVKSSGGYTITFTLYPGVLRKSGLQKGDKVDLLFDSNTGEGLIKKAKYGNKITNIGSRPCVCFKWRLGLPSINNITEVNNVSIKNGVIHFSFPRNTSFNGQARQDAPTHEQKTGNRPELE